MEKLNFIKNIWTLFREKVDRFDRNWVGGGDENYQPTLSKSILFSIIAVVGIFVILVLLIKTKPEIFPENASKLVQNLSFIIPNVVADLGILIYQFVTNKYSITNSGATVGRWFICHGIAIFVLGLLIATLAYCIVCTIIGIIIIRFFWRKGLSILFGK